MIWLLLAFAVVPLVHAKLTGGRKLTPLVLFSLSQFGGMALALAKLMPAMSDPSPMTWAVFWGMNLAYLAGYLLSSRHLRTGGAPGPFVRELDFERVLFILVIAFLFFASVAYSRITLGVWPLFAKSVDAVRPKFFGPNWLINLTIQFSYPTAILLAYGLFQRRAPRWLFLALWMAIPTVFVLAAARNMILWSLFCLMFAFELARGTLRIRWAALGLAAFLALFVVTSFQRSGGRFLELARQAGHGSSLATTAIVPIYGYVSNNFWNLDYCINKMDGPSGHPMTWGYTTLSGTSYFLWMNSPYEAYFHYDSPLNEHSSKVVGLNTISYQWSVYKDFGLALGCVFVFALGAWCSWAYRTALWTGEAHHVFLAVFAAFWSGYSPFVFAPVAPQNMVYLALTPLVYLAFRKRGSSAPPPAPSA